MDTPQLQKKETTTINEVTPLTEEFRSCQHSFSDSVTSKILRRRRLRRGQAIAATAVSCASARSVVIS